MAQSRPSLARSTGSRIAPSSEQQANNKTASQIFKCCEGGKCILHGGGNETAKQAAGSWSLTNMPKEISDMAIDPFIRFDAKATDIARHSMDDTLDQFQKAKLGFKSNDLNHKIFITSNLDNLIRQNADRTFRELMPLFDIETKKCSELEYHEAAAESAMTCYKVVAQHPVRAKQMLDLIVARIDSTDIEISDPWERGLEGVIDVLTPDELQRNIIPIVKERFARRGASTSAKKAAAKLIKRLVARLDENVWNKRLFPVIEILCADSESIVRHTMCDQLPAISERMVSKEPVLTLLKKLSQDSDVDIRNSVVHSICQVVIMIKQYNANTKSFFESVIPMLKKSVKEAFVTGNRNALLEFAEYMGRVALTFSDAQALNGANKLWFLDAFLHLSRYGVKGNAQKMTAETDMPTGFLNFRANNDFARRHSVIESLIGSAAAKPAPTPAEKTAPPKDDPTRTEINIRVFAAKEFVAFQRFAKPLVDFKTGLHPLITDLMHDPAFEVRAAMAESLYPIMEILGTDAGLLHGEFVYALSDDELRVVEGVLPNLANILKAFTASKLLSPENNTKALVEIGGAILFCEEKLNQTTNWRSHAMILEQMGVLPLCIPGDYIYNNFVPILFHRLLRLRQLPARVTAAYTIVSFLRHCRRSNHRDEIRKRIKESLAEGRSKQDRMLHLMMSQRIMNEFSRKYYRDHFFETNLDLATDAVANVRLKVVAMMPDMKKTLHLSDNETFLEKLEHTAAEIKKKEHDPDVIGSLESAMDDMQHVLVVFKDDPNFDKVIKTKADLDDEAKEMEENYIASLEPQNMRMTQKDKRKSFFMPNKKVSDPKPAPLPAPLPPPPPPPPPPPLPPPPPPKPPAVVEQSKLPMSNLSRRALKTFSKMPDGSQGPGAKK